MNTAEFFTGLWADYLLHCPSAEKIHTLLGQGEAIVNDHIALRTFATPELGLDALEPVFLGMGYQVSGHYQFKAKRLRARHYEHPVTGVPKVFISELLLEQFSASLQQTIAALLSQMPAIKPEPGLLYSGRHWSLTHADYQGLLQESEYAGWLAAFGFRANHFTVDINALAGFDSVAAVNATLKRAGFELNAVGGEIKGSPQVMLEQSSTLADKLEVAFSDGRVAIPACFYEFAYRYPRPDGQLFQGFVESSADKIFQSTDAR